MPNPVAIPKRDLLGPLLGFVLLDQGVSVAVRVGAIESGHKDHAHV